jgi:hypothetical protein
MVFQKDPSRAPRSLTDLGLIPYGETTATYYEALGRFITAYASAEAGVHELTRCLSKLSEEKARVIFAGMRLGDLTDRIRAMLRTDKVDEKICSEIDTCLVHLDKIAEARNKLVHRAVTFERGKLTVTNAWTAKTKDSIQRDTFGRDDLDSMAADCESIFLRLIDVARPSTSNESPLGLSSFREWLKRPWQYTPAPPASRKKSRRKGPEGRPRPPSASPA